MERDRYIASSSTTGVTERRHRSRSDKRVVSHSHDSFMRTNSNCSNVSTVSSCVTTANKTTSTNCNEDNHKGNNTSTSNASHRHPYHLEQKQKEQLQELEEQTQKKVKEIAENEESKSHSHASITAQNKTNEMKVKLDENKLVEQIHKMEEEYAHLYGLYTSQQEQLQGMSTLREEAKLLELHKTNTDESGGNISELSKYKELLCRINEELSNVHDLSVGADESKLQARLHVNANMGERMNTKKVHNNRSSRHNINALSNELQTHILHISQRLRLLMLSERNKKQTIQSMNSELESLKQKYMEPNKCNNANSMTTSTSNTMEIHQLNDKLEHSMSERDDAINSLAQVQQKLEMVQYQLERSNRRNGTLQREVEKMKKRLSESEQQWNKRIQEQISSAHIKCFHDNDTSSENSHQLSRVFVGKEFVILWRISPNEFVNCLEECINHVMATFTQERPDKQLHHINKCSIAQVNAHTHDVEVIFTIELCSVANTNNESELNVEMMQELEYLVLHEEFHNLHNLALSYLTQYDEEQQEEMHEQLRNDDEAIRTLHEQLEQYKKKANNLAQELECRKVKEHDMEELVARTFDETEVALVDMQHALNGKEHELEQLHSQYKNEIDDLKSAHAKSLALEIEKMKKSISVEIAKCSEKETNMRTTSLLHRFQLHIPVHFTHVTSKSNTSQVSFKEQQQQLTSNEKEKQVEEQKTMYSNVVELLNTLFTTNSSNNSNNNATSSTTRYFDSIQDLNVMKQTICKLLLNYVATITQTIPRRLVSCKVIELNNTTQHITERHRNKQQQESNENASYELLIEVDLMLNCSRNNESAIIANVQKILDHSIYNDSTNNIIFEVMKLYAHAREQVNRINTKLLEQHNNTSNASLQIKKYENELQEMRRVMSLFLQQWQKQEETEGDAKTQGSTATLQPVKQLLLSCQGQNSNITSTLSSLLELVNQDRVATHTQCQTLQTMIDKLNQNNAHMQLQVNKLNEQIKKSNLINNTNKISSGDNSFVTSMSAKLDVEKAKCKQLQEQLSKANAEKCTLQGQLKELEVDLTDFANIQSSLQEEISLLQRRLHAAEQDKEFLQYELNKTKPNVQSSVMQNNENINKQQKGSINIESKNTNKGRLTEEIEEEDAAASVTTNASFRSTNVEKTVTVYRSPIKTPPSSLSIKTNKTSNNNTYNNLHYSRPLPANQSNLFNLHGSSSQIMSHLYKRTHSSDSVLNDISNNNSISLVNNNDNISSSSSNKINTIKYANNTSKHTSPLTFTKSNSYTSGLSNKLSTTRPSRENSSNSTMEDNVIVKPSVYELSPFSIGNNMYNYSPTNSETITNNNNSRNSGVNKTNQNNKNDMCFNKNNEKEMSNKEVVGANALKRSYTSVSSISANSCINKSNSNNNTNNVSKAPALRHRFSRS